MIVPGHDGHRVGDDSDPVGGEHEPGAERERGAVCEVANDGRIRTPGRGRTQNVEDRWIVHEGPCLGLIAQLEDKGDLFVRGAPAEVRAEETAEEESRSRGRGRVGRRSWCAS